MQANITIDHIWVDWTWENPVLCACVRERILVGG